MSFSFPRLAALLSAVAILPLIGCSTAGAPPPGLTVVIETATASPSPATPPSPTPPPATPTPPPPPVSLKPAQIDQGGVAVVTLNLPATAATATFAGRQYPMLRDGERWWALLGVGALVETGAYRVSVSYAPAGGGPTATALGSLTIVKHDYPVQYVDLDPQTSALLAPATVNAEIAKRADIFASYTTAKLWSGPFVRPTTGALDPTYGNMRSYNRAPPTDYHRGTDFDAQAGDPVVAAAAGRVVFADALAVRGNTVIIDHGAGLFTSYSHLSRIDVAEGQMVSAGQQVGAIGQTGLATGPHLHWEVIVRGVEVDGVLWLQGTAIGP